MNVNQAREEKTLGKTVHLREEIGRNHSKGFTKIYIKENTPPQSLIRGSFILCVLDEDSLVVGQQDRHMDFPPFVHG